MAIPGNGSVPTVSTCGGLPTVTIDINPTCDANSLSVADFINCTQNKSQDNSRRAARSASDLAGSIICQALQTDWDVSRNEEVFTPTARPLEIPSKLDNTVSNYSAQRDALIPIIGKNLDEYMGKWWNTLYNPAYYAAAAKLLEIITTGGTGIPDSQEAQIWGAAEGTINAMGSNARNAMLATRRRRGLPITPFCLDLAEATRQNALRSAGGARREIANKRIDIINENMKWAVSEANRLWGQVGDRVPAFLNAFVGALDNALKSVTVDPNVMSTRINAIANLYGKEIEKDQLRFTSLNSLHDRVAGDKRLQSSNILGRLGAIISAGSTAADVHGKIAAAYLSQIANITQLAGSE